MSWVTLDSASGRPSKCASLFISRLGVRHHHEEQDTRKERSAQAHAAADILRDQGRETYGGQKASTATLRRFVSLFGRGRHLIRLSFVGARSKCHPPAN